MESGEVGGLALKSADLGAAEDSVAPKSSTRGHDDEIILGHNVIHIVLDGL